MSDGRPAGYFGPPSWLCAPAEECEAYWAAERAKNAVLLERLRAGAIRMRAEIEAGR